MTLRGHLWEITSPCKLHRPCLSISDRWGTAFGCGRKGAAASRSLRRTPRRRTLLSGCPRPCFGVAWQPQRQKQGERRHECYRPCAHSHSHRAIGSALSRAVEFPQRERPDTGHADALAYRHRQRPGLGLRRDGRRDLRAGGTAGDPRLSCYDTGIPLRAADRAADRHPRHVCLAVARRPLWAAHLARAQHRLVLADDAGGGDLLRPGAVSLRRAAWSTSR